jgi:hypothetical protein
VIRPRRMIQRYRLTNAAASSAAVACRAGIDGAAVMNPMNE